MRRRAALRCAVFVIGTACAITACASGSAERARRDADLSALRGQVDELKRAQDAETRERSKMAAEVKALDAQQAFLASEAKTAKDERMRLEEALARCDRNLEALRAAVQDAGRPPAPVTAAPSVNAPGAERSAEQLYELAMGSLRNEEHGQAVLEWTELITSYPEHPLAPSAQYWIGEAYFRQRDFRRSLAEFQKMIAAFPRRSEAPDALLKIGLCQRALNDPSAARQSWEAVVKDYPASSAAAEARTLLAQLGGPSGRTR